MFRIIKFLQFIKGKDMKSIYNSILTTKNGSTIPVFGSGKTAESKYNPQLEAQKIVDGINKNCDFFCTRANGLQEAVDIILEQEKFLKTFLTKEQNKKLFNYDTD